MNYFLEDIGWLDVTHTHRDPIALGLHTDAQGLLRPFGIPDSGLGIDWYVN